MSKKEIVSEVAGNVWLVEVAVGAQVAEDQTLLIIESMKMEIPIDAPAAGKILEILVKKDDIIAENQVVAVMEI